MTKDIVTEKFCSITNLTNEEALKFSSLIDLVIGQVEIMLKPDINKVLHENRLNYLAALFCNYKYCLLKGETGESNIKALDISVSMKASKNIEHAKKLMEDMMLSCSDILIDNDFYFRQVL